MYRVRNDCITPELILIMFPSRIFHYQNSNYDIFGIGMPVMLPVGWLEQSGAEAV